MEKLNFNCALKNTPTARKSKSNQLMLIEKIESFIKRMRWKAHFYLKKNTSHTSYINYGCKTQNYPSQFKELQNFEKDLLDTIKLIKSWIVKDPFQRKLKEGISNIKSSLDVYTFDYKIINIYNYLHDFIKRYCMKISPNPIKTKQPV